MNNKAAVIVAKQVYEKGSKYLIRSRFKPKIEKNTYIKREKTDWPFIIAKSYLFFIKSKCYK